MFNGYLLLTMHMTITMGIFGHVFTPESSFGFAITLYGCDTFGNLWKLLRNELGICRSGSLQFCPGGFTSAAWGIAALNSLAVIVGNLTVREITATFKMVL
jgi:hypothetical protein